MRTFDIDMKSRLLQLTSSPSGHQGEILHVIGANPWHVKGLAGKVVWIGSIILIEHIHVVEFYGGDETIVSN